jgi:LysM repeat protein
MKHLIIAFLFLFPIKLQAFFTGDSLNYLNFKDTIFITTGNYQEKIFEHQIAPRQTLYSLAKFYGLSLTEVYYYNPELEDAELAIGQAIKIPIPNMAIKRYKDQDFEADKHIPVCYKIKPGDTMYGISKRIFEMPIDTILARNNLTSFTVSPGQILKMGWMHIGGIPESYRKFRGHPLWKNNQAYRNQFFQGRQVKKEFLERGIAHWQKESKQQSEFLALHRKAPINSIIAINNPMNNRTLYAKVIGRIPDAVYENNVVVVLSPKAAMLLGARDANFFVKMRYLK